MGGWVQSRAVLDGAENPAPGAENPALAGF